MFSESDYRFMAQAIALAERGLATTDPNPRVGCVLVRDGQVVGEGWHEYAGGPHAEVNALAAAGPLARGATAYVTLEPCSHHGRTPPCSNALLEAGVARVVAAMEDPNPQVAGSGLRQLHAAGVAVQSGLLASEAEALNPGFLKRMRSGRPYLRCKLAMSLDGRTAMASGQSKWITSSAARSDVQRLRARSSAILSGIGTVLADDPAFTVRDDAFGATPRQPLRVVVDSRLRTPVGAQLFQVPGRTLVVTGCEDPAAHASLRQAGADLLIAPDRDGQVDLNAMLAALAERQVNEVLVEAGATLNGALLRAGLIDELVFYMAPLLMGDGARGLFSLPGLAAMEQAIGLEIVDSRAVGPDWRFTARVRGARQ